MKGIYLVVRLVALVFIGVWRLVRFIFWDYFQLVYIAMVRSKYWEQRILWVLAIGIPVVLFESGPVWLSIGLGNWNYCFLYVIWLNILGPGAVAIEEISCKVINGRVRLDDVKWGASVETKKWRAEVDETDPDYIEAKRELDKFLRGPQTAVKKAVKRRRT